MSDLFKIKKLLSDTKKVLAIASCGLLLIANIVAFAYLSAATMIPGFACVIASCLISIFITAIIYKPISKIIEEEAESRLKDERSAHSRLLEEKQELESKVRFHEQKALEREGEVKRLKSELDTVRQYKSISSKCTQTLKVESMEYEKEGYIVKEEYVRDNVYGQDIKKGKPWLMQFGDKGDQKVLYIKKYHEKALIGLNIEKIRFCRHDGKIFLEGIAICNLHPEMKPLESDREAFDAINRCEIINTENFGKSIIGINTNSKYEDFKMWYSKQQEASMKEDFAREAAQLCEQYTIVLRQNLCRKFPGLNFVDGKIESVPGLEGEPIYSLGISQDFDILEVSSSIMMIASTISQTMPTARR